MVAIGQSSFPTSLYFDNNLNMLFALCEMNRSFTLVVDPYIPINISHPITNEYTNGDKYSDHKLV